MNVNAKQILNTLNSYGFKAYIVGGAVRDFLMEKEIHDWDITTNAKPSQIKKIFNCYDSGIKFGTVTAIVNEEHFEITTFRKDGEYLDGRRPLSIEFSDSLLDDAKRRDFTINCIYMDVDGKYVDPFGGIYDIINGVLRAVGNAEDRFNEDALRILRGYRFAGKYGLHIETATNHAMFTLSHLVKNVSKERLAEELEKILISNQYKDIHLFADVIQLIIPEIVDMLGFKQYNPHHDFDVWVHTYKTLCFSPKDFVIRLALLLHDIGKPSTFELENGVGRFRNHGVKSADITEEVMNRLKFSTKLTNLVTTLVREHDAEVPNKRTLKRLLGRIGQENFERWAQIREADVRGQKTVSDAGKLERLAQIRLWFLEVIEENEAFSLKDLNINGFEVMELGYEGKEVGEVLNKCLEMVIEDASLNTKEQLFTIALFIEK